MRKSDLNHHIFGRPAFVRFDDPGNDASIIRTVPTKAEHEELSMCGATDGGKSQATLQHPLEPLSKDEIAKAAEITKDDLSSEDKEKAPLLRFETIELLEPSKAAVRAFDKQEGEAPERKARVNAFYVGGGIGVYRVAVSLTRGKVLSKKFLPEARPMIQLEEFEQIEKTVRKDPRVIEAFKKRGITDMSSVCVDPWSSGTYGFDYEKGRHLSYAFIWLKSSPYDNLYAHPVEGLNTVVDIKAMKVIAVEERDAVPVPEKNVNYDSSMLKDVPTRTDLKDINVSQPDGVSFKMDGHTLKWHEWSILVGFNAREGITLHNVSFGGRPVCYRASIAEMVVPYGSPRAPHFRKNVFDIGEYGLGNMANSLELGCDCLGSILYLDCWLNDMHGKPYKIKNGICIHEEDHGILWKHWDFRNDRTQVRRARRLVVSSISTVGNYEYGSYWYFYLDGMIEFEMKATGIINTVACHPGNPEKWGTEVSPGVVGQIHQHHFCARLDMSIDGDENTVMECDTVVEPADADTNPFGNAFFIQANALGTEGGFTRNPDTERYWKFVNPNKTNHTGNPVGYKLEPAQSIKIFCDPDSLSGQRMAWAYKHLWVTPYDEEERYPTGEYVNQSDGKGGLAHYVQQGRSIVNTDIVAWHTFGLHHPVRCEDFPVQNCVNSGFKLMPNNFFDLNPNMDMPEERNGASCHVMPNENTNGGDCSACH